MSPYDLLILRYVMQKVYYEVVFNVSVLLQVQKEAVYEYSEHHLLVLLFSKALRTVNWRSGRGSSGSFMMLAVYSLTEQRNATKHLL
jgi:hypothetical protein